MRVIATKAPRSGNTPPWSEVAATLANVVPFRNTTGSMKGTVGGTSYGLSDERFPHWMYSQYVRGGTQVDDLSRADYVVWSYRTPIAWRNGLRWTVPDITYSSPTTSQHQRVVRSAVYVLEPQGDVYARHEGE